MKDNYQICSRCVLDTSEPTITFDDNGVCRFCNDYDYYKLLNQKTAEKRAELCNSFIDKIKLDGKNKEYDCIIGLSGGVDSSYVAYLVKKIFGLRPLAVHLDNGWNDELAVSNIENICKILNIDLYTHVINWEEFKDLQLAFLKASVANAEAPTDHAIFASLFNTAVKHKVKWIIDGVNDATEYTRSTMTVSGYRYDDLTQIKGIHKLFGNHKMSTFPSISIWRKFFLKSFLNIQQFSLLNYIEYNKAQAKELLVNELGWRSYGAKHHESLYTKWHQAIYLPKKFGFDKRRLHLSDLILSNQISRNEALIELKSPVLTSGISVELERYVMKKLDLSEEEYLNLLKAHPISYSEYPNDNYILSLYKSIVSRKNVSK